VKKKKKNLIQKLNEQIKNNSDTIDKLVTLEKEVENAEKAVIHLNSIINSKNEENTQLKQTLFEQIKRSDNVIKELPNTIEILRLRGTKILKLEDKIKNLEEAAFNLVSHTPNRKSDKSNRLSLKHLPGISQDKHDDLNKNIQKELKIKEKILKRRDAKILKLAEHILKMTEQVQSLQFDLEYREKEQDILLQRLNEQVKKKQEYNKKEGRNVA